MPSGIGDFIRGEVAAFIEPKALKQQRVEFAEAEIAKASAKNKAALGYQAKPEILVDGRPNVPLASVRPHGVIEAKFDLMQGLLTWISQELFRTSPVKSGRYRDSHLLFADGREVKLPGPIPEAKEYVFLNAQPYARKLEGESDHRRKSTSRAAPEGIYQAVSAVAHHRFGHVATIGFGYQALRSGSLEAYVDVKTRQRGILRGGRFSAREAKAMATRQRKSHAKRRQPAIYVSAY